MGKPTKLKLALVHAGILQEDLMRMTGIPRNTISRIANGTVPTLRHAQKIARALGTTVDELWPLEESEHED
ncbi:helix-turn-helix transcriptional regulator [Alicyclobacillus fastidiosus]|uniref:Helix-turn-helix transcriptional regulator n=1 Tax=Alicyclobacillus fastidiosus TaxID=392011 RepID=A0ABV5AI95_9BACL|nr:helix-turn-helix transcriptional regulator [Alicyclobacillus fastidiosus]WEH11110.1 helix-turn-helix transcriptional regulator [Alicyclobacillus fastidiosus]